jgi:hypothetical protein
MSSDAESIQMLRELRAQTRAALVAANAANSRLEILEDRFERRIVPAIADIARHERQIDGLNTKTQKLAEMFNQNMNIMADKGEEDLRTLLERIGAVEEKEKRVDTFSNDELKQKLAAVEDDHIAVIELQLQMETYKQEIDELRTSSVSRQNQEWLPSGNSGGTTASHNSDSPIGQAIGQASEFQMMSEAETLMMLEELQNLHGHLLVLLKLQKFPSQPCQSDLSPKKSVIT